MKKILITFGVLSLPYHFAFAQSDETFWANLELGYGWTLADKGRYRFADDNDRMNMSLFQLKLRYYVTDALSLTAGVGLTPYHNYNITTTPVSAGLQYDFVHIPRLFAYADVGFPLSAETASSDFFTSWFTYYDVRYTSGFAANAGAGYRIASSARRSLYVAVGYHLLRYNVSVSFLNGISDEQLTDRRAKHAILLRVGYTFDVKRIFG
jgi:hypothetical protein